MKIFRIDVIFILALATAGPAHAQRLAPFMTSPSTIAAAPKPTPFASNNGEIPQNYKGQLFSLSHAYPGTLPPLPAELPWRKAIGNGPITVANAAAYVAALKNYVAADMRGMLSDPANWNAAARGWYNEPWTGYLREAIHGTYVGSANFASDLFKGSGLTKDFTTYVLTFYDRRAANALYNVWGTTALNPSILPGRPQFAEAGISVKVALTTANADVWPVMQGALQWPLYITTNATTGDHTKPQIDATSFMQFDLIVKDTKSAPGTGWVFATLVYDKDAPGKDVWDKMVPLGAMWGNDPEANSAQNPPPALKENWINPSAPAYSKMTLGWGGRLSGPNDGAVNDTVIDAGPAPVVVANLPSSSCMSCHSVAEWPMKSFLLPVTAAPNPIGFENSDYLVMWPPGSPQWMQWFQSRPGTVTKDEKTVAFDYDMVFVFKSLHGWQAAQGGGGLKANASNGSAISRTPPGGNYNGRPFNGH